MSLEDVLKSAAGIMVSFTAGIGFGYLAEYKDAFFERKKASITDSIATAMIGVLPQAALGVQDPLQLAAMYLGGGIGAIAGRYVGRKLWHRRYDKRTLTEEHKKRLEELKHKLKETIRNEEESKKAEKEYEAFIKELVRYNAKPALAREIIDQTAREQAQYEMFREMLEQIQGSQEPAIIIRAGKNSTLNGLMYIHDNNKWIRIETTIDMHAVRRDGEPFTCANCNTSITNEDTRDNTTDIAEELRTTDRLMMLVGGNIPLDVKKSLAIINYAKTAIMYALQKQAD